MPNTTKDFLLNIREISLKYHLSNNGFVGDLAMVSINGELKVFDFENKEVLNLLKDEKKYKSIRESYFNFKDYFDIPIKRFNCNELYFVEEYVEFKPYTQWTTEDRNIIIKRVFGNYTRYFKDYDKASIKFILLKEIVDVFNENIENKSLATRILEHINFGEMYDFELPNIWLHGDLDFHNIILCKSKAYFIDWEFNASYIFLFDVLNVFMVEYIYQNDEFYLLKYLEGVYDIYFDNLFKIFELKYDTKKRKDYICIFIIERAIKCELIYNPSNINRFLEKSIEMLNRIDEIELGVRK